MIDLKFRAWVKPHTGWDNTLIPGYITKVHSLHLGTKKAIISNDFFGGNRSILFEYIELDQWTGAYDKNKVEIYTGDILREKYRDIVVFIKYTNYEYRFYNIKYPEGSGVPLSSLDIENFEVVGDIYTWKVSHDKENI